MTLEPQLPRQVVTYRDGQLQEPRFDADLSRAWAEIARNGDADAEFEMAAWSGVRLPKLSRRAA